jgi:glutamate decarboxylase
MLIGRMPERRTTMTLHPKITGDEFDGLLLSVNPLYARDGESTGIPKYRMPDGPMPPDMAYEFVHDELMLDGNARLNLATFVTTWMEP